MSATPLHHSGSPRQSEFDPPAANLHQQRGSYYEMQTKSNAAPGAVGTSPLAGAGSSRPGTPTRYAAPAPMFAEAAGPAGGYNRNSYFASLGQGNLAADPAHRPPSYVPVDPQYYPAHPVMMAPYPGMVVAPHPGFGFGQAYAPLQDPEGRSTADSAAGDPHYAEDGTVGPTKAEATNPEAKDGAAVPGKTAPRKQGLRRLMCCAPRYCVASVFGVLIALFLILFFAVPRVPTIGIAAVNLIDGPFVTYNRQDKNFGLDLRANVTIQAKSANFYPLTVNTVRLFGYDSASGQQIGNGTAKNFHVPAMTTTYYNGTFDLSFHSSNNYNVLLNSLYARCTPSAANDHQGTNKTGDIPLVMIAEITINSLTWLGIKPNISVNTQIVCPDE
ncbi:hypothetical protein IWQ60_005063 [Tieghemiomyces parasiticus]|uniref:Late embryogenesis abundant protein LEA-2 subgroup domain-containing protein n=1 Tax=Tieghemiomyces parasiticus TaxID=78921 RepID=A0A9W8AES6_9FUNG|nr:hypothetical protein IWQ60_005063 [Tieghemiomyces parasiticus]